MKYIFTHTHTPERRWGEDLPLPQSKCHVLSDGVSFPPADPAFEALPGALCFTCLGCQVLPSPSLMQHGCPFNCTVLLLWLDCPGCDRALGTEAESHACTHAHWDAGQAHASMHSNTQLMQTDWGTSICALILNTPTCAKHFSLSKEKHGKTKATAAVA